MVNFRLKVQKFAQACLFELSWGTGQQLSATLHYPEAIVSLYQEWLRIYLSFYQSAVRGRLEASGSLEQPPIDWKAKLVQAEAKLLYEFHHWLHCAELFEIRAAIAKNSFKGDSHPRAIDVYLTCTPRELERLPWEAWEIGAEWPTFAPIRMVRTPANIRQEPASVPIQKRRRARILAILGDDTGLNFQKDREAVESLSRLAEIEFVGWQPGEEIADIKAKICAAIVDEQGWDVLFFAGHSNETVMTGGELAIAPHVSLSISEIQPLLLVAKSRGLQFALFNSCSGLSIANSLIDLGLSQVAVMREPIRNDVAQVFLGRFMQGLAEHKDVHESLMTACQYLKVEKILTYPSAYLIPSLFCHPGAVPFRIPPKESGKWLRNLLPTRTEAIALSAFAVLSLSLPVQDFLLEKRLLIQAIYRQITRQISPVSHPPVLLLQIDEKSIREAKISNPKPMNRKYLASIVDKLVAKGARTIGIDYLLDRPQAESDRILAQSLQAAAKKTPPTWFVLASVRDDREGWLTVHPEIASSQWSLQGHINLTHWYMSLVPKYSAPSQKLPFPYLLALAHQVQHLLDSSETKKENFFKKSSDNLMGEQLEKNSTKNDLQSRTISYLNREQKLDYRTLFSDSSQLQPLTQWSYHFGQMWLHPIIDFSIPPEQVYELVSAWQLLSNTLNAPPLPHLQQQAVVIASAYNDAGVFKDGDESFPLPAAVYYWLHQNPSLARSSFTGGEVHAYIIHHLLTQRLVVPIPDLWMIGLAVLLGKVLVIVSNKRKAKLGFSLLIASIIYGLFSLQMYITGAVLLPWLFPVITLGIYGFPQVNPQKI
ncbi:MAG: CHASE2 domain-containing protein [Actinomycetota bacterium]